MPNLPTHGEPNLSHILLRDTGLIRHGVDSTPGVTFPDIGSRHVGPPHFVVAVGYSEGTLSATH